MGLGSGTTPPNQGQTHHGSKWDKQGKCSPCVWRVTPGSWRSLTAEDFSPLRCSGVPQGSQTLSAIDTRRFSPLKVLKTWSRAFLQPQSPPWASSSDTPHPRCPQEHPHPPAPHAPQPPRAPIPESLPEKLHGKGDASLRPPASARLSIPQRRGWRGTVAAPRRPAPKQVKEAHFSYRNRVFKINNCLEGDGRRDLERRI